MTNLRVVGASGGRHEAARDGRFQARRIGGLLEATGVFLPPKATADLQAQAEVEARAEQFGCSPERLAKAQARYRPPTIVTPAPAGPNRATRRRRAR